MAKSGRKSVAASGSDTQRKAPAPTERQKSRIAKARERYDARSARLSLWIKHDASDVPAKVGATHSDSDGHQHHFVDAFGSSSPSFAGQMLGQLGYVLGKNPSLMESDATNAGLAAVDGAAPRDEIEGMLAVEMVATHDVAMLMLGRAKYASTIPAMQEYGTLATKLLRTYAAQVEALAKLRRGGEQKVIVEHVHVYPGGQAIVGSVTAGEGGGLIGNGQQPHALGSAAALAYAPGAEMRGADQIREALPRAGGEDQTPLPTSRRRERKRSAGGAA